MVVHFANVTGTNANSSTPGKGIPSADISASKVNFTISLHKVQEISGVDGSSVKAYEFETVNITVGGSIHFLSNLLNALTYVDVVNNAVMYSLPIFFDNTACIQ